MTAVGSGVSPTVTDLITCSKHSGRGCRRTTTTVSVGHDRRIEGRPDVVIYAARMTKASPWARARGWLEWRDDDVS
jgi:hypothetical protein